MPGKTNHQRPSTIPFIKDIPAAKPSQAYQDYAEALASLICAGGDVTTSSPLTIGLFAPWGSGKSTLLQCLSKTIEEKNADGKSIIVNFNAWHQNESQQLAVDMLNAMSEVVYNIARIDDESKKFVEADHSSSIAEPVEASADDGLDGQSDKYPATAKNKMTKLANLLKDVARTVPWTLKNTDFSFQVPFMSAKFNFAEAEHQQKMRDAELRTQQVVEASPGDQSNDADSSIREGGKAEVSLARQLDNISKTLLEMNKRIIVMIDDLDRCTPKEVVQAIETINMLTGRPGMVFILALDHDYVIRALENYYEKQGSPVNGEKYLEKIIQIPFWIPSVELSADDSLQKLVGKDIWTQLIGDHWISKDLNKNIQAVIQQALRSNPRQTKRFLNTFLLLSYINWPMLHQGRDKDIMLKDFLYFLGLQIAWPRLQVRLLLEIKNNERSDNPINVNEDGSFFNLDIIRRLSGDIENAVEAVDSEDNDEVYAESPQSTAGGSTNSQEESTHDENQSHESSGHTDENSVKELLSELNERYGIGLVNFDDYDMLRSYLNLDDSNPFKEMKKISIAKAEQLMRLTATGAGMSASDEAYTTSTGRVAVDRSKWYWDGGSQKLSKWTVIKAISVKFRKDNKITTKSEFIKKFGEVIRSVVGSHPQFERRFNPDTILHEADNESGRDYLLKFTDDVNYWQVDWWCGLVDMPALGRVVYRPLIEHFVQKGYPIVRAR